MFAVGLLIAAPAVAQFTPCENGLAQPEGDATAYPCDRVDFLGRASLADMGDAFRGNDVWGWVDGETDREYALVGLQSGMAVVDVTDPEVPTWLGTLATHTIASTWRDIKVYADHAYVVSEAPGHGMQVFDLTELRDLSAPQALTATAHYDGVGGSHNVVINEATGFGYIVGAGTDADNGCAGGLHMVDLAEPAAPAFAGCFADDGYTHDAQCVIYDGPDAEHVGKELCFVANEEDFGVVDVTDKTSPALLGSAIYPNTDYAHQGWLTEDHRYLIANDEGDERFFGTNTRTLVFDMTDLDEPQFFGEFVHETAAVDHNLYVLDRLVHQANDAAGYRLLDAGDLLAGVPDGEPGAGLTAVGYFDTHPETDASVFEGAWSVYPYLPSGNVIVNDRSRGLFMLRPALESTASDDAPLAEAFELGTPYPNPFHAEARFTLRVDRAQTVTVEVFDMLGRRVAEVFRGAMAAGTPRTFTLDGNAWPAGTYLLRAIGEGPVQSRAMLLVR